MNLLDFTVTPLWLVWDTVRDLAAEDGVELAESELIGLAPLAVVPRRRRPTPARDPTTPIEDAAARPPRPTCDCATSRRARPSSSGSRRPRRSALDGRRRPQPMSGPFRVIEGGRTGEPTPGLLVVGASEVVTLAGGVRRGAEQGEVGRLRADDPAGAGRAGRRGLGGPDRGGRAAGGRRGARSRRRASRSAGSPGSMRPAGRSPPGSSTPTRTCCSPGTREDELVLRQRGASYLDILAAGGGILSTVAATRAASEGELLAHGRRWLDEMLGHGVTTVEAKSGYGLDLETELRLVEVAYRLGREGPIDVVPTWLGAHAVPPEFRARPDGTEAYVRSLDRRPAPRHRRPRPGSLRGRVLRDGRVQRRPVAAGPRGRARRSAWRRGCTPTSWRRPAARSWPPSSAPPRPTTSPRRPRRASRAMAAAAEAGRPGRRDAPARSRPGS